MSTSVATVNGVTVHNLTDGKVVPTWLPAAKRKELAKKDPTSRHKIDIIQDFGFPSAAQTIAVTPDARHIVATGTYAPRVRVYDTTELSMKVERYMDAQPVATCILGQDYTKLAFLQDNRTVEVHAAYGRHYQTRIPRFGRCMVFHHPTAELIMGASGPDIYRLNLEEGRFATPLAWQVGSTAASGLGEDAGVNGLAVSRLTALIAAASDGGDVTIWDPRSFNVAARVHVGGAGGVVHACSVAFDETSPSLAAGTSDGRVLLFDLRKSTPLLTKHHQYGLPVKRIFFHRSATASKHHIVLSADAKVIKLWDREGGAPFTNVEPPAPLNDFCLVSDSSGVGGVDSGMLMVAGEQERISAFYIPQLGLAPKWASFLDGITEEAEEEDVLGGRALDAAAPGRGDAVDVYEGYRFVTSDELATLGLTSLIGTPVLKAYMHGYFMDARLHDKVKASVAGFEVDAWRKGKVVEAIAASRRSRIEMKDDLPAVNRELAMRLMGSSTAARPSTAAAGGAGGGDEPRLSGGKRRRPSNVDAGEAAATAGVVKAGGGGDGGGSTSLLTDSRFSKLFADPDYHIDVESEAFRLTHPMFNATAGGGGGRGGANNSKDKRWRRSDMDSDDEAGDD